MNHDIEDELKRIEEEKQKADKRLKIYINIAIITLYMAYDEQNQLGKSIKEFKSKTRPSNYNMK